MSDSADAEFTEYRDASEAVASALLRRLTLNEKIAMLHQYAPAIPRLGIAPFRTGQEVLHGAAWLDHVTDFPQAVGLAASWDPELMEEVGAVSAAEVLDHHRRDRSVSRNVWGPVVNLLRDPRWGRNQEGYSEDPHLTAALAVRFCRGLRGRGEPLTAPTLKSFLAYNNETAKDRLSATGMTPRVFWEYDFRPFAAIAEAGVAAGVMLSYNSMNGRPGSVNPYLGALRELQPDLVVVADAHGALDLVEQFKYFDDYPQAFAAAMHAGLDSFTNNTEDPEPTIAALRTAVDAGLLTEARIDESVLRLLAMRARLGEFGPAPAAADEVRPADTDAHRALALRAAHRSIVLLRNRNVLPFDPATAGRIALIGPHADRSLRDWMSGTPPYDTTVRSAVERRFGVANVDVVEAVDRIALHWEHGGTVVAGAAGDPLRVGDDGEAAAFDAFEWGAGTCCLRSVANGMFVTWDEELGLVDRAEAPGGWWVNEVFAPEPQDDGTARLRHVSTGLYAAVVDGVVRADSADPDSASRFRIETLTAGADIAARAARDADTVVVLLGTHPLINGREAHDQADMVLPRAQDAVARAVAEAAPGAAFVIASGKPVAVPWLDEHAGALLWTAHGGQEHGTAIADVLFGDSAPAGRLPQTWYRSEADLGDILDYDIIKAGKTYQYFAGEPLYPFGHGLTYTTFAYGPPRLSAAAVRAGDDLTVAVTVANTGGRDSDEVVQLYVRAPGLALKRPLRQLCAFERVQVAAGEQREVVFRLAVDDFAYWDVARGRPALEPGAHELLIGRSSADIACRATVAVDAPEPEPRRLGDALARAVDCDDYRGAEIVDEARGAGEAMEAHGPGSWLRYTRTDLGAGVDLVVAQAAAVDGPVLMRVRADDPEDGPILAELALPAPEKGWPWHTLEAPASGSGVRDVYLVFTGRARLASFSLTAAPAGG